MHTRSGRMVQTIWPGPAESALTDAEAFGSGARLFFSFAGLDCIMPPPEPLAIDMASTQSSKARTLIHNDSKAFGKA